LGKKRQGKERDLNVILKITNCLGGWLTEIRGNTKKATQTTHKGCDTQGRGVKNMVILLALHELWTAIWAVPLSSRGRPEAHALVVEPFHGTLKEGRRK